MLMISATSAWSANYAQRLFSETRPDLNALDVPDSIRSLYETALELRHDDDLPGSLEAYSRLADETTLDPALRTHFLAAKAYLSELNDQYSLAMKALRAIKELRPEPEAEPIRFLADLEIARAMADSGGHPSLPDFNPTIQEKEQQFESLFATYNPYCVEVIDAHLKFGRECLDAASSDPIFLSYGQVALNHAREASDIVKHLSANPSLARDQTTLDALGFLDKHTENKLASWEQRYEELRKRYDQ
jgi:hypothetical protein